MASYTAGAPWTRRPAARHLAWPSLGDPDRVSAGGLIGRAGLTVGRAMVDVGDAVETRGVLTVVIVARLAATRRLPG